MKKLLIAPSKMALPQVESQIYQNILKQAADISLNLMAVKVENHPEQFLPWCYELLDAAKNRINFDLLDAAQMPTVKKLHDLLTSAISYLQVKMLRIAPWPVVAGFIAQHQELLALDERLALTDYIKGIRETALADMIIEDRLAFAGKHAANLDPGVYRFDVEWFAATKNAKAFHQLLAEHPAALDAALAHIPLEGEVTETQYDAFCDAYIGAFELLEDEQASLLPATRLLAMRRPDVFVPLSNNRLDALCLGLGLNKPGNRDFHGYWQDIVSALARLPWFTMPVDETEQLEQKLGAIRALLPTLFYYTDHETVRNSNYLKLLNKPKKASSATKGTRRGRESAEVLVDRALMAQEIPEHIRAKRDSIIAEVEKGRSVEETISLMRTIFG